MPQVDAGPYLGPPAPPLRGLRRTAVGRRQGGRGDRGTGLRPAPAAAFGSDRLHRADTCVCGQCGALTRAAFPAGVSSPVQYGPRLAATVAYLQNAHFLPEQRLAEILLDLFHAPLCGGTVAALTRKAAERWESFAERVQDLLRSRMAVKHLDETGFRIEGRLQWLHVLCTSPLTFYYVEPGRGAVLSGLSGCLVHNHWQTYCKRPGVLHGMCNAHHLRELQALVEIDGEDWARRMQQVLRRARRARRAAELAREQGVPLPRSLLARIERRYDRLLEQALAYHARLPGLPAGAQEAAAGTQSGVAAAGPQGVGAALLGRLRGAVYEQPGGAGHAHDEAAHEDLGVFPDGAGSAGLRDRCAACCRRRGSRAGTVSKRC